jgi:mannose-6-phosphate isomerase-like protein (cupin superfamily)
VLGWIGDIESVTRDNDDFRRVLFTGEHTQLTVMHLAPGEDIGREVHTDRDQFLRLEQGHARVELGRTEASVDEVFEVQEDWAVIVRAGVWHNIVNVGDGDLRLYSLYSPPEHPEGTVHRTKRDAEQAEHAGS